MKRFLSLALMFAFVLPQFGFADPARQLERFRGTRWEVRVSQIAGQFLTFTEAGAVYAVNFGRNREAFEIAALEWKDGDPAAEGIERFPSISGSSSEGDRHARFFVVSEDCLKADWNLEDCLRPSRR